MVKNKLFTQISFIKILIKTNLVRKYYINLIQNINQMIKLQIEDKCIEILKLIQS